MNYPKAESGSLLVDDMDESEIGHDEMEKNIGQGEGPRQHGGHDDAIKDNGHDAFKDAQYENTREKHVDIKDTGHNDFKVYEHNDVNKDQYGEINLVVRSKSSCPPLLDFGKSLILQYYYQ